MDTKTLILALIFSILFIFQLHVSFNPSKNEEEYQAWHMLRGRERKLMHSLDTLGPAPSPSHDVDCDGLCKHRCSLHSRQNVCARACGTCCVRCNCVPPGTYGNREICGKCYTEMTTHGNKTKCP